MLLGLRTAIYPVGDLAKAKAWYAQVAGAQPCFDQPFQRLLSLGGATLEPVTDVGEGIKVAAVRDPFGNRFGIIENPHFKASGA